MSLTCRSRGKPRNPRNQRNQRNQNQRRVHTKGYEGCCAYQLDNFSYKFDLTNKIIDIDYYDNVPHDFYKTR